MIKILLVAEIDADSLDDAVRQLDAFRRSASDIEPPDEYLERTPIVLYRTTHEDVREFGLDLRRPSKDDPFVNHVEDEA